MIRRHWQRPEARSIQAAVLVFTALWAASLPADGLASKAVDLLGPQAAHQLDQAQLQRAQALGLDASQVVRLASLVELEARGPKERALVAGVLLNRLRRGWHLDSQASLAHAMESLHPGQRPGRGDHRIDHPANTFLRPGLPAEPICAPSAEAIQAVLAPTATQRLVWFVEPDGSLADALPEDHRAELNRIRPDPAPPETVRGLHYVVSNERRPHQFRKAVERLGEVWIGVGAEQNYVMAGWARPSLLILLDFDQVVVDVHRVYRVAFLESDTPEAFVAFFRRAGRRAAREAITRAYARDRLARSGALKAYGTARQAMAFRLQTLLEDMRAAGETCFLTDPEQYAHLRELFRTDRVVAIRGDLTARRTLRQMGVALGHQGRTVRVAYLSNAEQYFTYAPDFKRNMRSLPADEWSLLLRTRPVGLDYTYVLQWYQNFLRWLDSPNVRDVRQIVPRRILDRHQALHQVIGEPPDRRVGKRRAGRGRKGAS